jgi:hypothetical protein
MVGTADITATISLKRQPKPSTDGGFIRWQLFKNYAIQDAIADLRRFNEAQRQQHLYGESKRDVASPASGTWGLGCT